MRVKIINAPGYEDEWQGTLLAYCRTVDGRPVAVIESDDGNTHVIRQDNVQEPRDGTEHAVPFYDARSPAESMTTAEIAREDRDYWNDRYDVDPDDESDDE